MLPAQHRLRRSADFGETVRKGRRASRPLLTVHLLARPDQGLEPVRAGLIVSKAVGGSVVRSRTSRRLRHLLRDRVAALPAGSLLVVRAAPSSAAASTEALGSDLDRALSAATRPRSGPRP